LEQRGRIWRALHDRRRLVEKQAAAGVGRDVVGEIDTRAVRLRLALSMDNVCDTCAEAGPDNASVQAI
jgi:hypothetical protein